MVNEKVETMSVKLPPRGPVGIAALLLLVLSLMPLPARANVYATNIKLNGSTTNLTLATGDSVTISYILNEPASLGATVNILTSSNIVRSLVFAPNTPGARSQCSRLGRKGCQLQQRCHRDLLGLDYGQSQWVYQLDPTHHRHYKRTALDLGLLWPRHRRESQY